MLLLSKKITSGIDSEKAAKLLLEKEDLSKDCVLLAVEMYLQKPVQCHSGNVIGRNEGEDCAKGNGCVYDSVFKKAILFVIKTSPDITITGEWLILKRLVFHKMCFREKGGVLKFCNF